MGASQPAAAADPPWGPESGASGYASVACVACGCVSLLGPCTQWARRVEALEAASGIMVLVATGPACQWPGARGRLPERAGACHSRGAACSGTERRTPQPLAGACCTSKRNFTGKVWSESGPEPGNLAIEY